MRNTKHKINKNIETADHKLWTKFNGKMLPTGLHWEKTMGKGKTFHLSEK